VTDSGLRETLLDVLFSPNEADRNGDSANIVDGLFEIARALHRIADALEAKESK